MRLIGKQLQCKLPSLFLLRFAFYFVCCLSLFQVHFELRPNGCRESCSEANWSISARAEADWRHPHWKAKTIFFLDSCVFVWILTNVWLRKCVCGSVLDPWSSRVLSSELSSHMDHKQGDYQTGLGSAWTPPRASVLLTKSCVRMCAYLRERERERESLCPYVTVFAHKHSTSIFPFLNMSDLNIKLGNFFITQPPCAHMATKLMVNVKVEWKGQGAATERRSSVD